MEYFNRKKKWNKTNKISINVNIFLSNNISVKSGQIIRNDHFWIGPSLLDSVGNSLDPTVLNK